MYLDENRQLTVLFWFRKVGSESGKKSLIRIGKLKFLVRLYASAESGNTNTVMLGARWLGELDPWRLNLHTKWGREEIGCGVGDPPNAKTIKKKKKMRYCINRKGHCLLTGQNNCTFLIQKSRIRIRQKVLNPDRHIQVVNAFLRLAYILCVLFRKERCLLTGCGKRTVATTSALRCQRRGPWRPRPTWRSSPVRTRRRPSST